MIVCRAGATGSYCAAGVAGLGRIPQRAFCFVLVPATGWVVRWVASLAQRSRT